MHYPPAPDGMTIYIVGDIHGRLDLLIEVQRRIDEDRAQLDPDQASEIYLGDYIDRGVNSAGVVSCLVDRGREVRTKFLRGNHEQMLLDFLQGGVTLKQWLAVGGMATLLSYGVEPALLSRGVSTDVIRRSISEKMPGGHLEFFERTGSYLRFGSYLAVHAGVRPGIALEEQTARDLLTIRGIFLEHEDDPGFIVVHGHTPTMEPELHRYRVNLDTGAFATNRLTCARMDADGLSILEGDGFRIADRP
jgi:serine/threonine protein phosphatase 1